MDVLQKDQISVEPFADDVPFTDDELAELAIAAGPDEHLSDDAVPFTDGRDHALLPDWYMPVPMVTLRSRKRRAVAAVFVFALLGVNAVGLCVTYGHLEVA